MPVRVPQLIDVYRPDYTRKTLAPRGFSSDVEEIRRHQFFLPPPLCRRGGNPMLSCNCLVCSFDGKNF